MTDLIKKIAEFFLIKQYDIINACCSEKTQKRRFSRKYGKIIENNILIYINVL